MTPKRTFYDKLPAKAQRAIDAVIDEHDNGHIGAGKILSLMRAMGLGDKVPSLSAIGQHIARKRALKSSPTPTKSVPPAPKNVPQKAKNVPKPPPVPKNQERTARSKRSAVPARSGNRNALGPVDPGISGAERDISSIIAVVANHGFVVLPGGLVWTGSIDDALELADRMQRRGTP